MDVETTRFGRMTVADEAQVYFPEGLLGFGSFREYVLIPANEAGGPILWLQSCQTPDLAFALCPADALLSDYRLAVEPADLAALEVAAPAAAAVYFVV